MDFDELIMEREVMDFSAFMLSDDELKAEEKAENERIEAEAEELKELLVKIEEAQVSDAPLTNKEIARFKKLSSNSLVLAVAVSGCSVEELKEKNKKDVQAAKKRDKEIRKLIAENKDLPIEELKEIIKK